MRKNYLLNILNKSFCYSFLVFLFSIVATFGYGQGTFEKTVTLSDGTVDGETRELSPATFSATDFSNSCEIIANVEVSITWRKTAGTCNDPTTGRAYHEETGFKLKGPDGTEVILAPTSTWTGNSPTGYITTVFSDDAGAFPAHAVPVSGTFKPSSSLFSHFGEKNASGSWVLVAEDNRGRDPLCVESYTIKITTTCNITDIETGTWTGSPAESVDNEEKEVGAITFTRSDFTSNCDPLKIKNVKVSINWTKTGGTCTNPTTGRAYHNETSFKLKSPTGEIVTLASTDTWSGGADIDYVTTVFVDSETTAPSGTPVSGRFKPKGTLSSFARDSPLGTWTLIAGDNAGGDELCVKSYSVSILTDACEDTYTTCNENEKILNGAFEDWTGNTSSSVFANSGTPTNWTVTGAWKRGAILGWWTDEMELGSGNGNTATLKQNINLCNGIAKQVKFSVHQREGGLQTVFTVNLGTTEIFKLSGSGVDLNYTTPPNINSTIVSGSENIGGGGDLITNGVLQATYWYDVTLEIPTDMSTSDIIFNFSKDSGGRLVILDDISVKDILPTWPNEPISRIEERMCEGKSFDLTSLTLPTAPTGYEYFWHTDSTPTTANKVADPTSVIAGTYYLFLGNDCCYSPLLDQIKIVEKICIDTDNDGITDDIDLDDDNDGILDVDECNNPNLITNGGFESGYQDFYTTYTYVDCVSEIMGAGKIAIKEDANTCWDGWGRTARSGSNFLLVDFPSSGTSTFWEQTVTVQPNTQYFFSGYISNLITANTSSPNPSFRWIVTDVTNSSPIMDGIGFDVLPSEGWKRAEVTFTTSPTTTQIKIQIQNGTAGSSGLDAGLDDLFLQAVCDADGDGTPNHLDPDSDDDGCSDADEAYQNTDADADNNGYYGSGIPTFNPKSGGVSNQGVDAEGKVIGASYGTPSEKYLQGLAISLASSPTNQITCVNDNAIFTASANSVVSANTPPSTALNYKWQYSTNGATWNDITTIAGINTISGATGTVASGAMATLTLEGIAANVDSYLFRAVFTSAENVCAEVITDFAPLTVNSTDSDGDGIADGCDLDDDNDGILDTDELNCTNTVLNSTNILTNGSFEDGNQGFSTSYTYIPASSYTPTTPFNNQSYAITSDASQCDSRWGDTSYLSPIEGSQFIALNFAGAAANTVFWQKTIPVTPSTKYLFSGNIANLFKDVYAGASGTSPDPTFSWTIVDDKGNTLIDRNGFPVGRNSGWMPASIEFTTHANSESVTIYLKNNLAGTGDYDAVAIDDMKIQAYYCDTDGDGIANHLDLDSDNDGCPDAIEGAGTFTKTLVAAQGGLTGGTGSTVTENLGNDVATSGSNIGIPTVAGAGQSKGGSQQAAQITIIQQPSNQTVCINDKATLTVKAKATLADGYNGTTHEPTYSGAASVEQVNYQWQKWEGTAWQNATESGNNGTANSNAEISYTTATNTIANNGDKYRVVLTSENMACEQETTSATLTVPAYTNNNPSNGFVGEYLCSSDGTTPQLTFDFDDNTFTGGKTYTITYTTTANSTTNTYTQILTTDPQSFTPGAYPTTVAQGLYTYKLLSITNDFGCTTPASEINKKEAQIRIFETPSCSISGETTVCPRATVSYTAPSGMSSYSWTITGDATISSGGNTQTVSVLAGSGNNTSFTLSLEITKEYTGFKTCLSNCSKTITVEDTTPPQITLTSPQSVCVADITNASYNLTTNGDVNTPPDYYQFPTGDTTLDITAITDACCGNDISTYGITWSMSPQSNGETISGTGQPSASIGTKKLWLDIDAANPKASYTAKTYTVTYTVTDCNNNVKTGTTTVKIKPRPKITIVN